MTSSAATSKVETRNSQSRDDMRLAGQQQDVVELVVDRGPDRAGLAAERLSAMHGQGH